MNLYLRDTLRLPATGLRPSAHPILHQPANTTLLDRHAAAQGIATERLREEPATQRPKLRSRRPASTDKVVLMPSPQDPEPYLPSRAISKSAFSRSDSPNTMIPMATTAL